MVEDSLTCLKNRRYIDERLPVEIVKAAIEEKPLSIIFMDIDDLKISMTLTVISWETPSQGSW